MREGQVRVGGCGMVLVEGVEGCHFTVLFVPLALSAAHDA